MPQDPIDAKKHLLLRVIAWCYQAASHYLNSVLYNLMTLLGHNELIVEREKASATILQRIYFIYELETQISWKKILLLI